MMHSPIKRRSKSARTQSRPRALTGEAKHYRQAYLDVVKHDEGLKAIPVVILTSSQAPAEILECYRRHANGYVLKPWGMEEFVEMLRQLDKYWNGLVVRPAAAA